MTRATTFRAAAVVGGFLIAVLMILTVSRAAFTNPTSNDGNSFTSGHVTLVNALETTDDADGNGDYDETGTAMFTVTAMPPNETPPGGDEETYCLEVRYTGNIDADIELDSISAPTTNENSIGDYMNLTIERHTSATCTDATPAAVAPGTLASPSITETAWSSTGPGSDSRYYHIEIELDSSAPNSVQDSEISGIDFEWLATST